MSGARRGAAPATGERLQKVMAAAGLGSRRALEKHIAAGEVTVDGKAATLGQSVTAGAVIGFADRRWQVVDQAARHRTLIYNKPEGEVTSRADPEGRATVFDRLPPVQNGRWVAIGRLDINTTGLLILTTDGELANAMMHPSSNVDREYACRIRGQAGAEQLERLRQGVELEDGPGSVMGSVMGSFRASFSDIQEAGGSGENHWYHVTIMEGRNREVRRLWESQGLTVSRLKRVRYGAAFLPKRLRMGQWSEITPREHAVLREDVGLPAAAEALTLKELGQPGGATKPGKRAGKRPAQRPGKRPANRPATGPAAGKPGKGRGKASKKGGGRPTPRAAKRDGR